MSTESSSVTSLLDRVVVCLLNPLATKELVEIEAESNTPPWSEGAFQAEFNQKTGSIWGARVEGRLAAFLSVRLITEEAHIMNFGVRKELRGVGIGRKLITSVIHELHQLQAKRVTLEVRASNHIAIKLYKKVGFEESGRRSSYYTDNMEDGITMLLHL